MINETVMLGCYTVLLRQERCPRTGWKRRAPQGFPRGFSQPWTGLLPSSASAAAFAQVCAASSGVPREDKELIISNYKLGSEHYAPCQGSKLMYLHCTGLWGEPQVPRVRRWQQGKHLSISGTGATAAHLTAKSRLENMYFWERLWKWEVSKELALAERSRQHCTVQHTGPHCIHRVRAGFVPKTTQTSVQRERAAAGWNRAGTCHLMTELRGQMLLAAAGPRTGRRRQGHGTGNSPLQFYPPALLPVPVHQQEDAASALHN